MDLHDYSSLVARGLERWGVSHSAAPAGTPIFRWGLNLPAFTRPATSPFYQMERGSGYYAVETLTADGTADTKALPAYTARVEEKALVGEQLITSNTLYRGCALHGATFSPASIGARNVWFSGCRFIDCDLGVRGENWTFADCDLRRTGIRVANSSHVNFWANRFFRAGRHSSLRFCDTCSNISVVNNLFDGTERGVVFQPGAEAIDGVLLLGNIYRSILMQGNGDEHILCEAQTGGRLSHVVIMNERMPDCDRVALTLWGTGTEDIVVINLEARGASALTLGGKDVGNKQTGVCFVHCVFRGGGYARLDASATGNAFYQCTWHRPEPRLSHNHQGMFTWGGMTTHPQFPVDDTLVWMATAGANAIEDCRFVEMPPGLISYTGAP